MSILRYSRGWFRVQKDIQRFKEGSPMLLVCGYKKYKNPLNVQSFPVSNSYNSSLTSFLLHGAKKVAFGTV